MKEIKDMETLEQECLKRGATETHLKAKIIPILLDVLADPNNECDLFNLYQGLIETAKEQNRRAEEALYWAERREREVQKASKFVDERLEEIRQRDESLSSCETAEARDKLRLAEYYKANAKPRIKDDYGNNYFIKGLAEVLSGVGADT